MFENSLKSGKEYYQFIEQDLCDTRVLLRRLENRLLEIRPEEDERDVKSRVEALIHEAERLALKVRSIPLPKTSSQYVLADEWQPLTVHMDSEILCMEVPLLISRTKSDKVNKNYLVSMLHSSFKGYFSAKKRERYKESVVIWFELVYALKTGRNQMRDHDNIETKIVKDLLVPHIVMDDCPIFCDDLCTSRFGEADLTYIHVVPRRLFPEYFRQRMECS